jgi:hypothetical protein
VRWGLDCLLKAATAAPDAVYVQVGDPYQDHRCWERGPRTWTPRERVQGHAEEPGVRRRRRDRGGAGGRVPRVPDLRPDLFVQTAAGGAKGTAVIYLVCIVHKDSLLSSGASCPVCVYICRRSISRTGTEARTATRSAPWPALLLLLLRLPSKRRYLLNGAVDSLLVLIHLC